MSGVERFENAGVANATFSVTTPFGDTTFRFVEREEQRGGFPDYVAHETPRGGSNRFGFGEVDHITSNFLTMKPALLWMEHVMGFEEYWEVAFHTDDLSKKSAKQMHGSGLKSVVMWDPHSGIKFANNEPAPPNFRSSQIHLFAEDHRGAGIQHTALTVPDIISTVKSLNAKGVEFMRTPGTYYDTASNTCATCPAAWAQPDEGQATSCTVCPAGRFEPRSGQAICSETCPRGTTGPAGSNASALCAACPAGTSTPAGFNACCGAGAYASSAWATSCTVCPAGFAQPRVGSVDGSRHTGLKSETHDDGSHSHGHVCANVRPVSGSVSVPRQSASSPACPTLLINPWQKEPLASEARSGCGTPSEQHVAA